MTPERIAELRTLVARHEAAIGPGGEKAWLDGQLARVVPALLDEVERLHEMRDAARVWRSARPHLVPASDHASGRLAAAVDADLRESGGQP